MYYRYDDDDYTEETGDPVVKLVYYCQTKASYCPSNEERKR